MVQLVMITMHKVEPEISPTPELNSSKNGLLGKLKWRDIGLTLFDVMDHGMSRCESNVVV